MNEQNEQLIDQLHHLTKALYEQCQRIEQDMDKNQPDELEEFLAYVEQRSKVIEHIQSLVDQKLVRWSDTAKLKIEQIQSWEKDLYTKAQVVFSKFANQMSTFQRGRQLTKYYQATNEPIFTDGAYFDKRK